MKALGFLIVGGVLVLAGTIPGLVFGLGLILISMFITEVDK